MFQAARCSMKKKIKDNRSEIGRYEDCPAVNS
jgi:hypothetical protein